MQLQLERVWILTTCANMIHQRANQGITGYLAWGIDITISHGLPRLASLLPQDASTPDTCHNKADRFNGSMYIPLAWQLDLADIVPA